MKRGIIGLTPGAAAALVITGLLLGFALSLVVRGGRHRPMTASPPPARPPMPKAAPSKPEASLAPKPSPDLLTVLTRFNEQAAWAHVAYLSQTIGPRIAGTAAEAAAERYAETYLTRDGYATAAVGPFPIPGVQRQSHDLVADHPMATDHTYCIVVGAHIDSIDRGHGSPGADDNGSGVAVLLEVAHCLRDVVLPYDLEFVVYGCEERVAGKVKGHRGSNFHVEQYASSDHRPAIAGMVCLDAVGVGPRLELYTFDVALPPARNGLRRRALDSAERLGLAVQARSGKAWSDHEAYARLGIPHVWLWRRGNPHYHSARDVAADVRPEYLRVAGRLTLHLLMTLEPQDLAALATEARLGDTR